jgi:TrmH family RNA methyltransferase
MSLTMEALKHQSSHMKEVILSEKVIRNRESANLFSLCECSNIPYRYDDPLIDRLSAKENCYCIGIFQKYETVLHDREHLILYHFNDLNDLGTVIRSAVSFDFKDIILIGSEIDLFDPACIRSSMGAFFQVSVRQYPEMKGYLKDYPDHPIYVFSSNGNRELKELKLKKPFSLLIAQDPHELDGYASDVYTIAHHHFDTISLAIRSSIVLERAYELKRVL